MSSNAHRWLDLSARATARGVRWGGIRALAAALVVAGSFIPAAAHSPAAATPNRIDDFYSPPEGFADSEPGTVLRSREIQASALQLIPMQVRAWQLLYRTTDSNGRPYAAVTTVLARNGDRAPAAILSYDSMIDAIAPDCMPSRVLRTGAPWFNPTGDTGPVALSTTASEVPMIAAGLEQNWVVSVPDLGGIENRFLTPREPGYVALDGVRAVQNFQQVGAVDRSTPALFWGYSGGGIATSWAAEVQPTYAPELRVAGMAIGAPVPDFATAVRQGNGSLVAGLVAIGLAGLAQDSPEFAALLDKMLTPAGRQMATAAAADCTPQNLLSFPFTDFDSHLTVPLNQVLADPLTRELLAERTLGQGVPTAPLYLYNGINDELSTIESADRLVDRYCRAGTSVTYQRDPFPSVLSAHTALWALGAPAALAWLRAQIDDPSSDRACSTQTLSTITTPEALNTLGPSYIGGTLNAILAGSTR
ncbi:lipase family protein [Rhodococcus daqingensis]|uniref:Lipase family protein n=1 Tax=Rhodococcus daqingensis TaxID=2479363 RepID=A0ABW2RTL0_9NOCA